MYQKVRNQGTGTIKSDCKHSMWIGIIRTLNECTGRLLRAATQYNHKSPDMQSKQKGNDQELSLLRLSCSHDLMQQLLS